ncbi:hypothetical protein V5O48_016818, partial [Marasmius crinis-equi]
SMASLYTLPTEDIYKNEKLSSCSSKLSETISMLYLPPIQPGESTTAFAVRALSPLCYKTEAANNVLVPMVLASTGWRFVLTGPIPTVLCPYELCGDLPPPHCMEANVLDLVSFLYTLFQKFQVAHKGHVTTINTYNATMQEQLGHFYCRENGEPMTKDKRRAVKSALFIAQLPELEAPVTAQ